MEKNTRVLAAIFFAAALWHGAFADESALEEKREAFASRAKELLGAPYKRGATGPDAFDCSGFVYFVAFDALKIRVPRMAQPIRNFCADVDEGSTRPGDLVFFRTTSSGRISHVGICLGDGKFIHAASDGPETGVIVSSLDDKYWKAHYDSAGTIFKRRE